MTIALFKIVEVAWYRPVVGAAGHLQKAGVFSSQRFRRRRFPLAQKRQNREHIRLVGRYGK